MEIRITTHQILKALQLLSWIIFIGLCVEAGSIIVNTVITLFIHPQGAKNFWEGAGYLESLYHFDNGYFTVITVLMIIVSVLKAIMFYLIIRLFVADKKLSITQPFSTELRRFILHQSYLALGIGLFSHAGYKYSLWLTQQGAPAANLQSLHLAGADVWLFMAVILLLVLQLVKRGIDIQNEIDLTI
jgi:hypothetical protein